MLRRFPEFTLTMVLIVITTTAFAAEVDVQCPAEWSASAGDVQVTVVYASELGDPPATGLAVYMAANTKNEFGSLTIYGPWYRDFACTSFCSVDTWVDTIPADAFADSMIVVGTTVLDEKNDELASDSCLIRVSSALP